MAEDNLLNLQPGTIVNGRYEIVKCLGTGSMGMVYACRHRELSGHLVAMKVLFSEVARDEVAAARFRNEIVASYGVSHPNVVRAYEYFRDGDLIAFTMEYIGGGDLADRLNLDEPLAIEEILAMLSQMCAGVQAIHDAGIIHRDLKPENILIAPSGVIKITDFGIARTGTGPKLTEHGGVVGTIDYVSPEYLERGQVDGRSDIYSLGVLAYEMITGEAPFKGKSVIETMTMRLRMDPVPPRELRRDCPESLSRIVLKAMNRDPERRYQAAAEMARDLEKIGDISVESDHYAVATATSLDQTLPLPAVNTPVVSQSRIFEREPEKDRRPTVEVKRRDSQDARSRRSTDNPVDDEFDSSSSVSIKRMESVLRAKNGAPHGASGSRDSISVSQSHLSVQRMQQLSSQVNPKGETSPVMSFFGLLLLVFLGFGVGIFIFRHYLDVRQDTGTELGILDSVIEDFVDSAQDTDDLN